MLDQLTKPARIYNPGTWTDEQHDLLKQCWAAGMSAQVSADKINYEFGTSYTRSAIIGRVDRKDLSVVYGRVKAQPSIGKSYPTSRRRTVAKRIKLARLLQVLPMTTPPPMPVAPLNILFGDLEPHHCREIVGNDGWQSISCGHPKNGTSSFCSWHHAINTWIPSSRSHPYFPMGGR